MGTIYEIICWTTGLRYIGQTTKSLKIRLTEHVSAFNTGVLNCSSEFVFKHGNYEIYELETIEDETLLREREKYYIQHTDCVNIRTYNSDRKAYTKEYNKLYRQTDGYKEKHRQSMKRYRERKKF